MSTGGGPYQPPPADDHQMDILNGVDIELSDNIDSISLQDGIYKATDTHLNEGTTNEEEAIWIADDHQMDILNGVDIELSDNIDSISLQDGIYKDIDSISLQDGIYKDTETHLNEGTTNEESVWFL
ncbi:hypothetical protein QE152_g38717 [Popillia japonica]|uniref:Uncharacterized protein n=1 Tax=Popillia japonica TaxID=7064 RepID=A0AAW1HVX2_POPJA